MGRRGIGSSVDFCLLFDFLNGFQVLFFLVGVLDSAPGFFGPFGADAGGGDTLFVGTKAETLALSDEDIVAVMYVEPYDRCSINVYEIYSDQQKYRGMEMCVLEVRAGREAVLLVTLKSEGREK